MTGTAQNSTQIRSLHFGFKKLREHMSATSGQSFQIPQINLSMACKPINNVWVSDRHIVQHVESHTDPAILNFIRLEGPQVMDSATIQELVGAKLRGWPLPENTREELLKLILEKTRGLVESSSPEYDAFLDVLCKVTIRYDHIIFVSDLMDWIRQRLVEESGPGMVPATDTSIELLQSKIIIDDDVCSYKDCSICLEELFRGCEALCMPCSHSFHRCCLQEWLRISHYCPNCRYEMPIS